MEEDILSITRGINFRVLVIHSNFIKIKKIKKREKNK